MNGVVEKSNLNTEIILGKDLPEEIIQMMERQRIKEYGENTKDFRNNERESMFFFLKDGDEVRAFGMLKPIIVHYENQLYPVMGIANVIAIKKSKGYGKALMQHMTKYLEENKLVGLGNTHKVNFEFYKKCGYTFVPGLLERFKYVKDNGEEGGTETQDYCMFLYDPLISFGKVVSGDKTVIIKVPFW